MDLNKRMKQYERCYKTIITPRSYIIVRCDGKNFSKYTKNLDKPFDSNFTDAMHKTAIKLCEYFNAKFAYTQSDEISLLITEIGGNMQSQPELGNVLQKLCSLTASVATASFNEVRNIQYMMEDSNMNPMGPALPNQAYFDSRVFVVPNEDEVFNHMLWRQQDASKNSISMAAHSLLGHKAIMNKTGSEKQDMMMDNHGVNWNDYPVKFKRGVIIKKETYFKDVKTPDGLVSVKRNRWVVDNETPIFTKDKEYLMGLIPRKQY